MSHAPLQCPRCEQYPLVAELRQHEWHWFHLCHKPPLLKMEQIDMVSSEAKAIENWNEFLQELMIPMDTIRKIVWVN